MGDRNFAHGMRLAYAHDRLVSVHDRRGHPLAHLAWRDGRFSSAMIWGAPGAPALLVSPPLVAHPVLGDAHALSSAGGVRATMAAIDWAAPRRLPAIDRPAALPPGAGTMLLDVIALAARQAGVAELRYDGPYPTDALWASLAQCFRARGDAATFLAGGDVAFAPAPFERVFVDDRAWVQLREEVERAAIDGRAFAPGAGWRRLVRVSDEAGDGWALELWLGDAPLARLGELDARGELRGPLRDPPAWRSPVDGQAFPPALAAALAELIAEVVPAPLAAAARAAIAAAPLRWADTGLDLARTAGAAIEVHAALWDRLAPHGLARVALALAEALAPIAAQLAAAALAP